MLSPRYMVPLLFVLAACTPAAGGLSLERCAEMVRDDPDELTSYQCYWTVARGGEWEGASRALESLLSIDPSNHLARLYLAAIEADLGRDRAERLYRECADGFASESEPAGEVYARIGLFFLYKHTDRIHEAREELDLALETASASEDPILLARIRVHQALLDKEAGEYGSALVLLRKAEEVAFPDGPVDLQNSVLTNLGHVYWAQGLREQAMEIYARQADILERAGLVYFEATARYNIALLSVELGMLHRIDYYDHVENLEKSLELAVRTGNRRVEARSRLLLGLVLGGERSIEEYTRALEISRSLGHGMLAREAQCRLATQLWRHTSGRREEALRMIDESIEEARYGADLPNLAYALAEKATMLADLGRRSDWIGVYEESIDTVEKIRDLQPEGTVGARLFTRWYPVYHRFSTRLLNGLPGSPDPNGDLELAFRTIERMRSRVLIDELDTAGAHPKQALHRSDIRHRMEILDEIARIQRILADPSPPGSERAAFLETLERLEMEESALRGKIARADPSYAALHAPDFPTLVEVRQRLDPDQAVLSYQVYSKHAWAESEVRRESWIMLITRDGTSAFPLPEKPVLEKRVSAFLGLCRRRDGTEAEAAEILFDDLLAEPLRAAGPSIRRLIVVPDAALHLLPFAALRPEGTGDSLGVSYEVSRVSSVTAWMRLRGGEARRGDETAASAVLALADPELAGAPGMDAVRSADPWLEGLQLGPLPNARSEARRIVHAVGGEGLLLSGAYATERALKESDLDRFGILHLAAHAVVDHAHPERSAVILAPGAEDEDGFLQMREIVQLDLRGKVVILSACQSASGTVLQGEGMLGLARAFFQAGARAVIGSLWPMRDDEAEILMGELARRLAAGQSLSGAVASVRVTQVARGAPVDGWASLVVLGDGEFVPVPGGRGAGWKLIPWLLPLLGLVLLAAGGALVYRRFRA